jgi:fluoride exporter
MTTLTNCIFVAFGGMIGSVSRYLLGLVPIKPSSGFPVITFIINIAGSFAIGLIAGALQKNSTLNPQLVLLLKVGVCGGFTTFSTFSLESLTLMQNGHIVTAALYIGASVLFGILAVLCGELLVQ